MLIKNTDEKKTFSEQQYREVSLCLSELAGKLRVSAVILVDSAGHVLARKVSDAFAGSAGLSTLAASTYAAAAEMARILGEPGNFKMVLHEGSARNVFISSVTPSIFLIVVFETGVAAGMVRLFTRKAIEALLPVVSRTDGSTRMDSFIDREFKSLLDQKLDDTFKEL